jgi:hypothetical protein
MPLKNPGAPAAGTNEVQTLTIGGTPTGGTFRIALDGLPTTAITWVGVNATLLASINAALDALPNSAASAIVATAGTLTAGIGTVILTFSGAPLNRAAVATMTVTENSLTGTLPTLAIAETTPGVDATARGIAVGGLLLDITNAKLYINTGTSFAPTWVVVGAQT